MQVNRRRVLTGAATTAALAGGSRLLLSEKRLYDVRVNGRAAGPRREGLTSTSIVWKAATDLPLVALTFDDGPDERFTPGVLAALARRDVPATFFLQGNNVERHPDLARQVAESHVVGNHSYSHPDLGTASTKRARLQLERAHEAIATATGVEATMFRPPYGNMSGATSLQAAQFGYDIMLWSQRIDSRATPESNVERLAGKMKPGDVVLGHDGGTLPNQTVVGCLPDLLVALADQGFELVTLPDLLAAAAGMGEGPDPAT